MADRFIPTHVRQVEYSIDTLTALPMNPASRSEQKALAGLHAKIISTHIITPLQVVSDGQKRKVFIVDGNRRFAIAKALGMKKILCDVIEVPPSMSLGDVFIAMNIHKTFDGKQDLEMIVKHGFFRVDGDRSYYDELRSIGGQEIIDLMLEKKQTLRNISKKFQMLVSYLNLTPAEKPTALRWMVENRQSHQVFMLHAIRTNKSIVRDCIAMNRPLGR